MELFIMFGTQLRSCLKKAVDVVVKEQFVEVLPEEVRGEQRAQT